MTAGLRPAEFWDLTTEEAELVIDGYKRRLNDWDDLLAHHAMQLLRPHMKKNARPDWREYKLMTKKKAASVSPEDLEEAQERAERKREVSEAMGPPALLKNKYGQNVTVTRLG